MKKFILIAVLGVFFLNETSMANELKPRMSAPTAVWIKLLINLHRPKMNCESGFGVCFLVTWGVDAPGASSEKNLCLVNGQLNERNQLVIALDEAVLAKYEGGFALRNFKDKTSVTIQDPYPIPDATCRALGSNTPLTIKSGNYPVSFQNGVYTVIFQL